MTPSRNPSKWWVAVAVMVPTFIEILDITIVNVSLNHIQGSLSAGLDEVTWVLTSYLVANAVVIPMSGWLAARIGRRRYLILSIVLFTGSSFACGSATSLGMLVLFRVLQGLAGGALQPLSNAILLETFPPREHGTAMAIFGMGIVLAPILGPILGGWITDNWNWRWIFYINVPVGVLSVALALLFIQDPEYLSNREARVDYWGIALLVVGVGSLQIVLDRGERLDWFASPFIVRLTVLAVVSLVCFVVVELRQKEPVVDLRVFRDRSFASGNLIMFFGFFAFFGSIVLLPIYVQKLMGYTSWLAGWVLAPGGVASFFMMPMVGRLIRRIDPRLLLLVGIVLNGIALYQMSRFNLYADFDAIVWPRVVQGIGLGFFFVPLATATLGQIPREQMGNASALFNFLRNLGGSFGVSVLTTQLARRAQFHQARLVDHLTPYDPVYRQWVSELEAWAATHVPPSLAAGPEGPLNVMYGELQRQAFMLGVNDVFFLDCLFFFGTAVLVLLMKKSREDGPAGGAH